MKLSDIIPDSQSLITRDYWERRNQLGVPGPEFKPEYANNPDYYTRDLNGYQTGSAQYDVNGVPIYNGQSAECQPGPTSKWLPDYSPNSVPYNNQNGIRLRDKTTIRTVSLTPSTISQQNQYGQSPDLAPRGPTPRTGNRAPARAADRWPMKPRRLQETFPGRP